MKKILSIIMIIMLGIVVLSSCVKLADKTEPAQRIILNKLGDEDIGFRVALKTNIYSGWQNLDFTSNIVVGKTIKRFDEINTGNADIESGVEDYIEKS